MIGKIYDQRAAVMGNHYFKGQLLGNDEYSGLYGRYVCRYPVFFILRPVFVFQRYPADDTGICRVKVEVHHLRGTYGFIADRVAAVCQIPDEIVSGDALSGLDDFISVKPQR